MRGNAEFLRGDLRGQRGKDTFVVPAKSPANYPQRKIAINGIVKLNSTKKRKKNTRNCRCYGKPVKQHC